MIPYRHEWKHELSFQDYLILRQRLRAVMEPDPHAVDGKYLIRSLYFDNAGRLGFRQTTGYAVPFGKQQQNCPLADASCFRGRFDRRPADSLPVQKKINAKKSAPGYPGRNAHFYWICMVFFSGRFIGCSFGKSSVSTPSSNFALTSSSRTFSPM